MKVTPKQYAQSLFEAVKGKKTGELKSVVDSFVKILIKNNQVSQLERVIDYFVGMWNKEFGVVEAEIKSAKKLDEKNIKLLNDYIVKLAGVQDVKIKETVDKKLLGGFVVKYGDKIMDNSLKTRLMELKEEIKK